MTIENESQLAEVTGGWRALCEASAVLDLVTARRLARLDALSTETEPSVRANAWFDVRYFAMRPNPRAADELARRELALLAASERELDLVRLRVEILVATAEARMGDLEAATQSLSRCELGCRLAGDTFLLMRTVSELARLRASRGESHLALLAFEEAIELSRTHDDQQTGAENLLNFGFLFGERDEAEAYVRHTRAALAMFEAEDEPRGVAYAHCNLAGGLLRLGDLAAATAHYATARELATERNMGSLLALCLAGEGGLLFRQGRPEEGALRYREANALCARQGNQFQVVRHLHLLGQHLLEAGLVAEAHQTLLEAVERGRAGAFRSTLEQSLDLLATSAETIGDLQLAIRCLRERIDVQKLVFDGLLEMRVAATEQQHLAELARRDAEVERRQSEDLRRANAELRRAMERQTELQEELIRLSNTDGLTGIANRRHVDAVLRAELARVARAWSPMSVMLIDVDYFKAINDTWGHDVGDETLVEVARRLRATVRAADPVARWGGEEFCVVLFGADADTSARPAEAILAAIGGAPIQTRVGGLELTVSVGVASLAPDRIDLDDLLRRADAALYEAKRAGRNTWRHARDLLP